MKRPIALIIALSAATIACTATSRAAEQPPVQARHDGVSAAIDPAAANYTGRKGAILYVSKLGDDSDGSSWAKAFRTIQAAVLAIPDDKGGHQVVIRPDTYVEANLHSLHKGAAGSYNLLVGDVDGSLGSGATGRVVIDSGDPEKGFKSVDWWSTMRAYTKGWATSAYKITDATLSCVNWDRWIFRNLYATGGDAGLFWDLTDKSGAGFTVIVEDCVSIGRAFGAGFGYPVVRNEEPSVFRRSYLMSLDWWGDAGAAGIGAYNTSPPDRPDVIFEDCTFVSPDNAVQVLFPSKHIRAKFKDCRLIVLNFSQPRGTPSSGIICSEQSGNHMHADLEDCILMGYTVFGTGGGQGKISCTTKGKVGAYVEYEQPVPEGIERLGLWPVDTFNAVGPAGVAGGKPVSPSESKAAAVRVSGDPSAPGYAGRKGTTIYVSKLGDNSDGSSWAKAFHTIQAGWQAVPDDKGGHCVIIRPDTYVEANLHPSHKGAEGSFNLLVGDFDGSLGSGAKGWVVVDSSTPEIAVVQDPVGLAAGQGNTKFVIVKDGPKVGHKSVDWWAPWRTGLGNDNAAFDRWIFRNIYATGSEAGMYFEAPGTRIVENCVSIGRAFGGGGASMFRGCYFMCLDRWGDAGGVAISAGNASMPEQPDVVFDDCTIVGPDNAVQVLNLSSYVRAKFKDCRLIVLNFSQPRGTPSSGIICCDVADSKYLHVDLEDCTLMGYKVFGTGSRKSPISYTTKGKVQAYVQFEQSVPDGFERLGLWPVDIFDTIGPPNAGGEKPAVSIKAAR